jgi:hypothetical protein
MRNETTKLHLGDIDEDLKKPNQGVWVSPPGLSACMQNQGVWSDGCPQPWLSVLSTLSKMGCVRPTHTEY